MFSANHSRTERPPAPGHLADTTLIVRECGERTADACVALLGQLAPGYPVHRVSGRPFSATLREALQVGHAEGRSWTLCLDADVLPFPKALHLLTYAAELPPDAFLIQGLVIDKLFACRRPAGNHLYRTSLIPLALQYIPGEESLRPESDMINAMQAKGFPWRQSAHLMGLHDFEQSPADLYAKAYLHGHKHRHLAQYYEPLWRILAKSDADYEVALTALARALAETEIPLVSRDYREAEARTVLEALAITGKAPLGAIDFRQVDSLGSRLSGLDGEAIRLRDHLQQYFDNALFPEITGTQRRNLRQRMRNIVSTMLRWIVNAAQRRKA